MLSPIEIFCCYAHEDRPLLQELLNHLKLLQRQGLIQIWSDHDINAGVEWEREIEMHLEASQIVLLLVSSDFLASEYCYSKEMKRAMERDKQKEARVMPVLLRHVNWKEAPFAKLEFLPTNAKPVTDRSWSKDEALTDVSERISTVVKEMRLQRAMSEANKLAAEKHHKEALLLYEQILDVEPEYLLALRGKERALLGLEQYEESLDAFDNAKQVNPKPDNAQEMLNANTNVSDGTARVINDVPIVRRVQRSYQRPPSTLQPSQSYPSSVQRRQPNRSNEDINKLFDNFSSTRVPKQQKQIQAPIQRSNASSRRSDVILDEDDIVDEALYVKPRKVSPVQIKKKSESSTGIGEILGCIMLAVIALAIVVGIPILLIVVFRVQSLLLLFLIWLYIGLVTGFLASFVLRGGGYGVISNFVVGIVGALIGGFIMNDFGLGSSGLIYTIIGAFVGACILIFILRLISGSTRRI